MACAGKRDKGEPMQSSPTLSEVEQLGHVRLPASVTHLEAHIERGIDAAVWARFELPEAELDGFLASAGYQTLSSTERALDDWHLPTKAAWWTPSRIPTFRSGRLRRESSKPRYAGHVLASSEGAQRTVYLFVTSL